LGSSPGIAVGLSPTIFEKVSGFWIASAPEIVLVLKVVEDMDEI